MRDLPDGLSTSLSAGATTLARCWRITRTDGAVMGFTDHDRALSFDGLDFEADAGLGAGAIELTTGLAIDNHGVTGALSSPRIAPADLARGVYDGAEVQVYLVDWTDVAQRVVLARGQIGEITRGEQAFEAEILGLSERLNQPVGRAYLPVCDCRLGDAKCGIDLGQATFRAIGTVAAVVDTAHVVVNGLTGFEGGWFTGGLLSWTDGENAGQESHVKAHLGGVEDALELWLAPPMPPVPGDMFDVTAGCDKTAETCREKFANLLNFRGFPHMPGDDFAATYPSTGGANDGSSLFR